MSLVKYRNDYVALNILVITDFPSPQSGPKSLTEFRHEMGFPSKLQKKKNHLPPSFIYAKKSKSVL